MNISTLTSKGQITIPKDVRCLLHLYPGDKIDFFVNEKGEVKLSRFTKRVSEVFGCLTPKASRAPISVRAMDEGLTAGLKKDWQ